MGSSCREPAVELHWAAACLGEVVVQPGWMQSRFATPWCERTQRNQGDSQVKMSNRDSENSPADPCVCVQGFACAVCSSGETHCAFMVCFMVSLTLRACQKCRPHSFGRVCVTRRLLRRETRRRFQPPFSLAPHLPYGFGALSHTGSPNSDPDSEMCTFFERPPVRLRRKASRSQRLPTVRCSPENPAGLQTRRPGLS